MQAGGDDGYGVLGADRVGPKVVYAIETDCICARARVLRSADDGRRWHRVHRPGLGSPYGDLIAFANPSTGWMTGFISGGHVRLFVTHDAAQHWLTTAVTGVRALAVRGGWVYAATTSGIWAAPTTTGHFSRVSRTRVDTLDPGRDAVYGYVASSKTAKLANLKILRLAGHTARQEHTPCPDLPWSEALTEDPSGSLILMCGGEGGTGTQQQPAYRQQTFRRGWQHAHALPGYGYVSRAFSSGRRSIFTGSRAPLEVTRNDGRSWGTTATHDFSGDGYFDGGFSDPRRGWVVSIDGDLQNDTFTNTLDITNDAGRHWHQILRRGHPHVPH